jgi:hypothetical protein
VWRGSPRTRLSVKLLEPSPLADLFAPDALSGLLQRQLSEP